MYRFVVEYAMRPVIDNIEQDHTLGGPPCPSSMFPISTSGPSSSNILALPPILDNIISFLDQKSRYKFLLLSTGHNSLIMAWEQRSIGALPQKIQDLRAEITATKAELEKWDKETEDLKSRNSEALRNKRAKLEALKKLPDAIATEDIDIDNVETSIVELNTKIQQLDDELAACGYSEDKVTSEVCEEMLEKKIAKLQLLFSNQAVEEDIAKLERKFSDEAREEGINKLRRKFANEDLEQAIANFERKFAEAALEFTKEVLEKEIAELKLRYSKEALEKEIARSKRQYQVSSEVLEDAFEKQIAERRRMVWVKGILIQVRSSINAENPVRSKKVTKFIYDAERQTSTPVEKHISVIKHPELQQRAKKPDENIPIPEKIRQLEKEIEDLETAARERAVTSRNLKSKLALLKEQKSTAAIRLLENINHSNYSTFLCAALKRESAVIEIDALFTAVANNEQAWAAVQAAFYRPDANGDVPIFFAIRTATIQRKLYPNNSNLLPALTYEKTKKRTVIVDLRARDQDGQTVAELLLEYFTSISPAPEKWKIQLPDGLENILTLPADDNGNTLVHLLTQDSSTNLYLNFNIIEHCLTVHNSQGKNPGDFVHPTLYRKFGPSMWFYASHSPLGIKQSTFLGWSLLFTAVITSTAAVLFEQIPNLAAIDIAGYQISIPLAMTAIGCLYFTIVGGYYMHQFNAKDWGLTIQRSVPAVLIALNCHLIKHILPDSPFTVLYTSITYGLAGLLSFDSYHHYKNDVGANSAIFLASAGIGVGIHYGIMGTFTSHTPSMVSGVPLVETMASFCIAGAVLVTLQYLCEVSVTLVKIIHRATHEPRS